MSYGLFIIAVTCYLISMVASLISALFVKNIPKNVTSIFIAIHFLSLILWLMLKEEHETTNYFFLAFICSGILIAGLLLRSSYPVWSKIYFSVFLLSLVAFVLSPSLLLNFIISGNLNSPNTHKFHIYENYFLIEQNQLSSRDSLFKMYKLTREMSMFHKTIRRDIAIPVNTDSVFMVANDSNRNMQLRLFYPANGLKDSMDIKIDMQTNTNSQNDIRQIRK